MSSEPEHSDIDPLIGIPSDRFKGGELWVGDDKDVICMLMKMFCNPTHKLSYTVVIVVHEVAHHCTC